MKRKYPIYPNNHFTVGIREIIFCCVLLAYWWLCVVFDLRTIFSWNHRTTVAACARYTALSDELVSAERWEILQENAQTDIDWFAAGSNAIKPVVRLSIWSMHDQGNRKWIVPLKVSCFFYNSWNWTRELGSYFIWTFWRRGQIYHISYIGLHQNTII